MSRPTVILNSTHCTARTAKPIKKPLILTETYESANGFAAIGSKGFDCNERQGQCSTENAPRHVNLT